MEPATTTTVAAATTAPPVPTTTAAAPAPPPTTTCPANLAQSLSRTDGAAQLLTVEAPGATSSATVTAWTLGGGCWRRARGPFPARIGIAGLRDVRHEGDGSTPTGIFGLGATMYGTGPDPGVHYAYHRLVCGDYWDEDPTSVQYNQFVPVGCGSVPSLAGGSEALWKAPVEYASLAVIDYNTDPVVAGRGSGIFLAVAAGHPTVGCVSLAPGDHNTVMTWLDPAAHPRVVMGTPGEITGF
ncbi:MAG: L,D-transpeptidase family protein [Acidimicrobiales bacterium]